jgi:hypothetical protein
MSQELIFSTSLASLREKPARLQAKGRLKHVKPAELNGLLTAAPERGKLT